MLVWGVTSDDKKGPRKGRPRGPGKGKSKGKSKGSGKRSGSQARRASAPRRPREIPDRLSLDVPLDELEDQERLRARIAEHLGRTVDEIPEVHLVRKAIDARGRHVRFHLTFDLGPKEDRPLGEPAPREVDLKGPHVVVVGDGPAGLFAAYQLARHGVRATVVDRGKTVQPRRHDLKGLQRKGTVNEDSNYCFGEGGAGTYSDGKLYTRSDKRGDVQDVLELLAAHGAPERILTDARPHIGSNKLPKVVTALREHLEELGQTFRFGAKVTRLVLDDKRQARGVLLSTGEEIGADAVILATGHSARDIYRMLDDQGVRLEAKPFALGVRIEHPQSLINKLQYGSYADHPKLPNAYYRVAHTEEERGVFSFCMCPGGWVVPASTEQGALVVNGMSLSRRDSPFANSGFVVAVSPELLEAHGFAGPMGGLEMQARIEEAAWQAGEEALQAPATRASDFLRGRSSTTVPATSYLPGLTPTNIAEVLECTGVPFVERLQSALRVFESRMPGYAGEEAVLIGVESRTSSPVRIPRDPKSLQSPDVALLYPTAEGAGYAGGIVSAAIDGMRVADAVVEAVKVRG